MKHQIIVGPEELLELVKKSISLPECTCDTPQYSLEVVEDDCAARCVITFETELCVKHDC